jgi:hypothetical protein
MYDKASQIKLLGKEIEKQKRIFRKHMGKAINPDGSEEYRDAKSKFDAADRKIKDLDKELARLVTDGEPLDPVEFHERFPYLGRKPKKQKSKLSNEIPAGAQINPSQSKVKHSG